MVEFRLRITGDLGFKVWQDIEGFEGVYKVSTYGRVKSVERKNKYRAEKNYYDLNRNLEIRKFCYIFVTA